MNCNGCKYLFHCHLTHKTNKIDKPRQCWPWWEKTVPYTQTIIEEKWMQMWINGEIVKRTAAERELKWAGKI